MKFIEFTKVSKDIRILLVFDGHVTQTSNIKLIDEADDYSVVIMFSTAVVPGGRGISETSQHLLRSSNYCVVQIKPWARRQFRIAELFRVAFIR